MSDRRYRTSVRSDNSASLETHGDHHQSKCYNIILSLVKDRQTDARTDHRSIDTNPLAQMTRKTILPM